MPVFLNLSFIFVIYYFFFINAEMREKVLLASFRLSNPFDVDVLLLLKKKLDLNVHFLVYSLENCV